MRARCALRGDWRVGHRSTGTDEGFTLLELVAALTILATGIVGVMSVTNSSIHVASAASARSKAVALATERIEEFRAEPYEQLDVKTYPSENITVGGRSYHVESAVEMRDVGALLDAYKAAYVIVSWTDQTYHEVRQETIIYPGGRGPYVPPTTAPPLSGGNPSAPTNLTAVEAILSDTVAIDLLWDPPLTSDPPVIGYIIQYSTDAFVSTQYEVATSNPTPYYRVTDLSPAITYHFRVLSVAANGNRSTATSNTASVTTSATVLSPCRVGVVSVTPKATYKAGGDQGNKLKTGNPSIAVNTTGDCLLTTLTAYYSPNPATNLTAALTPYANVYTGLLDGNQAWDVGRHEIIIKDGTGAQRARTFLLVCEPSRKVCR